MWDFDFNYDEDEDEQQQSPYNFDFGQNNFGGFNNFNMQSTPEDVYGMSELYNVPMPQYGTKAADQYSKYVSQEPTRQNFKPSLLRRIGAGAVTALDANQRGLAAGMQTGQKFLEQPYERAREEWSQRARQMAEQARIEQQRNALARQQYQNQLTAAQARVNARRQARLADNTLESGKVNRESTKLGMDRTRQQMQLDPIERYTDVEGNQRQYNVLDPRQQTVIGRTNAATPGERKETQSRNIGAAWQRANLFNNGANQRAQWTDERTRQIAADNDARARDLARPPSTPTPPNQAEILQRANVGAEFKALRDAKALWYDKNNRIVFNSEPVDAAVARARGSNTISMQDKQLLEAYEKMRQMSDPTFDILELIGGK